MAILTENDKKVNESLAKKFDHKPVPKVVTGDSIRKQYGVDVAMFPQKPVSTTVDDALNFMQMLRNAVVESSNLSSTLSMLIGRYPDKAERLQPMLEAHGAICEDLSMLLKELVGSEGTSPGA